MEKSGASVEQTQQSRFADKIQLQQSVSDDEIIGPITMPYRRETPKPTGKNAQCPCGSGKRYRRCCKYSGGSPSESR